jgi:hypothetical protein
MSAHPKNRFEVMAEEPMPLHFIMRSTEPNAPIDKTETRP